MCVYYFVLYLYLYHHVISSISTKHLWILCGFWWFTDSRGRLEASHRKPNNTARSTPYPFDAQPFLAVQSARIDHMTPPPGNTWDAAKKHISLQRLHCSSSTNLLWVHIQYRPYSPYPPQAMHGNTKDLMELTDWKGHQCFWTNLCHDCHGNKKTDKVHSIPQVPRSVASQAAGSSYWRKERVRSEIIVLHKHVNMFMHHPRKLSVFSKHLSSWIHLKHTSLSVTIPLACLEWLKPLTLKTPEQLRRLHWYHGTCQAVTQPRLPSITPIIDGWQGITRTWTIKIIPARAPNTVRDWEDNAW